MNNVTPPAEPAPARKQAPSLPQSTAISDFATACSVRQSLLETLAEFSTADGHDAETMDRYSAAWDLIDEAERVILDHAPADFGEAAAIVAVLMDAEPQRSDGLDQTALQHVERLLRAAAT